MTAEHLVMAVTVGPAVATAVTSGRVTTKLRAALRAELTFYVEFGTAALGALDALRRKL